MIDRILSLLMALCLGSLIWLYTRSREQEMLDNVTLPVEVSLVARQADLFSLELPGTPQVVVSFSGTPQRIRELHHMLQRKELRIEKTISVADERLNESRIADSLNIEADDINAPVGVTAIVSEGRNRISYTLHRLIERRLPVRFDHLRDAPAGTVILDPSTVMVRGPKDILERTQFINTKPSDLPSRPVQAAGNILAIGKVSLVEEIEGRAVRAVPASVQVRVPNQVQKTYELNDVQVQFLCPPNFHLRPKFIDERSGKLTLKLQGPAREESPKVYAFIDLTKGKFVSGLNHEPLQIQIPRDFQMVQEPPRVIAFELLPGDFMPDNLNFPTLPASPPPER